MSDKTEEATPQRRRKAMKDGDVAVSSALVSASAFVIVWALAPAAFAALFAWTGSALRRQASSPATSPDELGAWTLVALEQMFLLVVPVLTAAALTAALVAGVQAGGVFSLKKILPDFSRLSPLKGIKSLVSATRLTGLLRSLLTAAAVYVVTKNALTKRLPDFAASVASPSKAAIVATTVAHGLVRDVMLVLIASAFVDVVVSRRSWSKRLRMSKDEVKREAKESEGDPHLKAARERAHQELMAQASIHAVKSATVVVVNPTHVAAALRYRDGEDEAPSLLAKGEGAFAARIVEAARLYGVPVVQDIPLARALLEMEVGDEIPETLYEAVAEILRTLWERAEDHPTE